MSFVVYVVGPRISATFYRDTASEAVGKAKEMVRQGAVSITDPRGEIWIPDQFDEMLQTWPEQSPHP